MNPEEWDVEDKTTYLRLIKEFLIIHSFSDDQLDQIKQFFPLVVSIKRIPKLADHSNVILIKLKGDSYIPLIY